MDAQLDRTTDALRYERADLEQRALKGDPYAKLALRIAMVRDAAGHNPALQSSLQRTVDLARGK